MENNIQQPNIQSIGKFEINEQQLNKILTNIYKQLFKQQTQIHTIAQHTKSKASQSNLNLLIDRTITNEPINNDYLAPAVNHKLLLHSNFSHLSNEPFHTQVQQFIHKFTTIHKFIESIGENLQAHDQKFQIIQLQLSETVNIDQFTKELNEFKEITTRSFDLKQKLMKEEQDTKIRQVQDKINQLNYDLLANNTQLSIQQNEITTQVNNKIGSDQLEGYFKAHKIQLGQDLKLYQDQANQKLILSIEKVISDIEILNSNSNSKYQSLKSDLFEMNETIQKRCVNNEMFMLIKTINDDRFKEQSLKLYELFRKCDQINQIDYIQKNLTHLTKDHESLKNLAQCLQIQLNQDEKQIQNLNQQIDTLDLKPERVQALELNINTLRNDQISNKDFISTELANFRSGWDHFKQKIVKQIQIFNNSFMNEKLTKDDIIQLLEREVQNQSVIRNRIMNLIQQSLILPNGMNLAMFYSHVQTNLSAFAKKIENVEMNQFKPKHSLSNYQTEDNSFNLPSNKQIEDLIQKQIKFELEMKSLNERMEEFQEKINNEQLKTIDKSSKNLENVQTKKCLICGDKCEEKEKVGVRMRSSQTRENRRQQESLSLEMGEVVENKGKNRGAWFSLRSSLASVQTGERYVK